MGITDSAPSTLMVSGLTWLWVSLSREMELWLRPPTTAISVLKFCSCSSFWGSDGEGEAVRHQRGLGLSPAFPGMGHRVHAAGSQRRVGTSATCTKCVMTRAR